MLQLLRQNHFGFLPVNSRNEFENAEEKLFTNSHTVFIQRLIIFIWVFSNIPFLFSLNGNDSHYRLFPRSVGNALFLHKNGEQKMSTFAILRGFRVFRFFFGYIIIRSRWQSKDILVNCIHYFNVRLSYVSQKSP